ncbi:FAD dependent oxidoreductase [Streptomyces sp. WMMB 714]|nr:FAD dependent oxidoreductase [Streptomyces sp. WMMB 714]
MHPAGPFRSGGDQHDPRAAPRGDGARAQPRKENTQAMPEIRADLVVAGGSLGGVAAALAACRLGRRVVLTEETDWLGGQLTSQAVPPDEHPWIEKFGCTASYRQLREDIRAYYRTWYPLTEQARGWKALNPGAGRVSRLCHEPRAALSVIEARLAPHVAAGRLTVLLRHRVSGAETDGDRVRSLEVRGPGGETAVLTAPFFLDATDHGDMLPAAGAEYVVGAESADEHGEAHAPATAAPGNVQSFTVTFALSHHEGEDHTIDRPDGYAAWRAYEPDFWTGPLLSFTAPVPSTLEPRERWLEPNPPDEPIAQLADPARDHGDSELWMFRRILARGLHTPGAVPSDITLVNWPMNDYWLGPIVDVDEETAAEHLRQARQLSLSLLHWLQTEAPRADGGTGFPGLRLRPDVTGTPDGLAKAPYVRESRRIRALHTVTENDVSLDVAGPHGSTRHADSVGIGSYRIDLHPSTGGDNYIDIPSVPFQIPLGSLVPVRVRNLLPACKNLGATHISNGCLRLHPVEWNIGEAASLLAVFCLERGAEPQQVHADEVLGAEFCRLLERQGIERAWPEVRGY